MTQLNIQHCKNKDRCEEIDKLKIQALDMWHERKAVTEYIERINNVLHESFMIEGHPFGKIEGNKIMEILDEWATKY